MNSPLVAVSMRFGVNTNRLPIETVWLFGAGTRFDEDRAKTVMRSNLERIAGVAHDGPVVIVARFKNYRRLHAWIARKRRGGRNPRPMLGWSGPFCISDEV